MQHGNSIIEYLNWRGDLPFSIEPFNEVDNVILAQLAYVDFDGIVMSAREDKIPVGEVCSRYWEMHTEEEIRNRQSFVRLSPFLLKPVAESRRFEQTKMCGYINYVSKNTEAQMSAIQFELEDGTTYVAFRGTDETLVGWKEDFNLSYMSRTEGQRLAVEYLKEYFGDTNCRLRVGGHSKGGNFAIYASAFSGPKVEAQIEAVYSNDSPGFREEITETPEYKRIVEKTVSIIPRDSLIGKILTSGIHSNVVMSAVNGIKQHDAMTWQVFRNRFVRTERSGDSVFFEKVISGWLDHVDDEARKVFVDQIFNILQSSGANTMKDVREISLRDLSEALQMARSLPKDQQKEISQVLKQLFRSGEKTFYEQIGSKEGRIPEFVRRWAAKRESAVEAKAAEAYLEELESAEEENAQSTGEEQPESAEAAGESAGASINAPEDGDGCTENDERDDTDERDIEDDGDDREDTQ